MLNKYMEKLNNEFSKYYTPDQLKDLYNNDLKTLCAEAYGILTNDSKTELKVINLLHETCLKHHKKSFVWDENADEPIWDSILNLSKAEQREFLKECEKIINPVDLLHYS